MKTFLLFAGVLLAIFALPFVVALFLPKTFTVESEVVINRPRREVFDYLKLLKNQEQFSKWARLDPAMKKQYRGTDGTVGAVFAWESTSANVGIGEQEITQIVDGERIDVVIRFQSPFESTDPAYLKTESVGDAQTKVTWGYHGKMRYPTNLMTPIIRGTIKADMQTGLDTLKAVLEKR